jgi:hypothetical protein
MNDTSIQTSPFVGHLVPGIGYVLFGLILMQWYLNKSIYFYRRIMGVILLLIVVYAIIALMVDMFHIKDTSTKFHRVLTMAIFPLAITLCVEHDVDELALRKKNEDHESQMVPYDVKSPPMKWEWMMMMYCVISTIMYMGHQHKEEPDGLETSMMMPSPEEQVCLCACLFDWPLIHLGPYPILHYFCCGVYFLLAWHIVPRPLNHV